MRFLVRLRRRRQVRNARLEERRILAPSEPFSPDFVERLRDHCADYSEITAAYLYDTRLFSPSPGQWVIAPTLGLVFRNTTPDESPGRVIAGLSRHFGALLNRELVVPPGRGFSAAVVVLADEHLASVAEAVRPFFERSGSPLPAS
jgi:hypothetical protein